MSTFSSAIAKDKKPFTYLPGGIDFSQLKSPKMAKRIAKHQEGIPQTVPAPSLPSTNAMESPVPVRNQRSGSLGSGTPGPFIPTNSPLTGASSALPVRRSISDLMATSNYNSSTLPVIPSTKNEMSDYNPYAPNNPTSLVTRSNSLPPTAEFQPTPIKSILRKPQPPKQGLPPPHPQQGLPPPHHQAGLPPPHHQQGLPPQNQGLPPVHYQQGLPPTHHQQGLPPRNPQQGILKPNSQQGLPQPQHLTHGNYAQTNNVNNNNDISYQMKSSKDYEKCMSPETSNIQTYTNNKVLIPESVRSINEISQNDILSNNHNQDNYNYGFNNGNKDHYQTQISNNSHPSPSTSLTSDKYNNLPLPVMQQPPTSMNEALIPPPPPPPPPPPMSLGLVAQYGKSGSGVPYIGPKPVKSSMNLSSIRAGNTNFQEQDEEARKQEKLRMQQLEHQRIMEEQQKREEEEKRQRQLMIEQLEREKMIEAQKLAERQQREEEERKQMQLKIQQLEQQKIIEAQQQAERKQREEEEMRQKELMMQQLEQQKRKEAEQQQKEEQERKQKQFMMQQFEQQKNIEGQQQTVHEQREQAVKKQKQFSVPQSEHQKLMEALQEAEKREEEARQHKLILMQQLQRQKELEEQQYLEHQQREEEAMKQNLLMLKQLECQKFIEEQQQAEYQQREEEEKKQRELMKQQLEHQRFVEEQQLAEQKQREEEEKKQKEIMMQQLEHQKFIEEEKKQKEIMMQQLEHQKFIEEQQQAEQQRREEEERKKEQLIMQELEHQKRIEQQLQAERQQKEDEEKKQKELIMQQLEHQRRMEHQQQVERQQMEQEEMKQKELRRQQLEHQKLIEQQQQVKRQQKEEEEKKEKELMMQQLEHERKMKEQQQLEHYKKLEQETSNNSTVSNGFDHSLNEFEAQRTLMLTPPVTSDGDVKRSKSKELQIQPKSIDKAVPRGYENPPLSSNIINNSIPPIHSSHPNINPKQKTESKMNKSIGNALKSLVMPSRNDDEVSRLTERKGLKTKEENLSDPNLHNSVRLRPPSPGVVSRIQFNKSGSKPSSKFSVKKETEQSDKNGFQNQENLYKQNNHIQNKQNGNHKIESFSNPSSFSSIDTQLNSNGSRDGFGSIENDDEIAGKIITGKMKLIEAQMKRDLEAKPISPVNINIESGISSKRSSCRCESTEPICSKISGDGSFSEGELSIDETGVKLPIKMAPYEVMEEFEDAPEEFYLGVSAYNIEHPIEKDDAAPMPPKVNNTQIMELEGPFESEPILNTPQSHSPVNISIRQDLPNLSNNRQGSESKAFENSRNMSHSSTPVQQQPNYQPFPNKNTITDQFQSMPSMFCQEPFMTPLTLDQLDCSFPNTFSSPFSMLSPTFNMEGQNRLNNMIPVIEKNSRIAPNVTQRNENVVERSIPIQVENSRRNEKPGNYYPAEKTQFSPPPAFNRIPNSQPTVDRSQYTQPEVVKTSSPSKQFSAAPPPPPQPKMPLPISRQTEVTPPQISGQPPKITPAMLQNQIASKMGQNYKGAQENSSNNSSQSSIPASRYSRQNSVKSPIDFHASKTDADYRKNALNAIVGEISGHNSVQPSKVGGLRKGPNQSPSMRQLGRLYSISKDDSE